MHKLLPLLCMLLHAGGMHASLQCYKVSRVLQRSVSEKLVLRAAGTILKEKRSFVRTPASVLYDPYTRKACDCLDLSREVIPFLSTFAPYVDHGRLWQDVVDADMGHQKQTYTDRDVALARCLFATKWWLIHQPLALSADHFAPVDTSSKEYTMQRELSVAELVGCRVCLYAWAEKVYGLLPSKRQQEKSLQGEVFASPFFRVQVLEGLHVSEQRCDSREPCCNVCIQRNN